MKKNSFFILIAICLFSSCYKKDDSGTGNSPAKILILKVDYLTNTFEGGTETTYPAAPSSFTISTQYTAPGDVGGIKIIYKELNQLLFDGSIIWSGLGHINTPQNILPADQFTSVTTADVVKPAAGFENIFNLFNGVYDYAPVWASVQKLVKVREYINANPNATVKLFLYTPIVGAIDLAEARWIIFLKS